jgi:4-amino-4-deoxy-L-arabinose transferase-like glycosyltransferase/membrane-associated phospholipid phosphatase
MAWLHALDVNLFHFVNLTLRHPVLDPVMRFLSGNALFAPVLAGLGLWLLWKGGRRGRVLVLMMALILPLGDGLVVNPLKHMIGRERPATGLTDAHLVMGSPEGRSMPSAHAASWFAATMLACFYYRRTWRLMLPLAAAVALSRVYVGAHYPTDVAVGAILGAGYAAAGVVGVDVLWAWIGGRWFPLWWRRMPSLLRPELDLERASSNAEPDVRAVQTPDLQPAASHLEEGPAKHPTSNIEHPASNRAHGGRHWMLDVIRLRSNSPRPQSGTSLTIDQHWLRLGYIVIFAALAGRLAFIASGAIELSKDEAYQWLWSKHLALSYYSKPPLIAYTQWLGTHLWGDTAFGVRFFAPVIGAALGLLLLRWMAKLSSAQTAFCLVLVLLATPLLGVGTTLLTIDPLLVMFWTLAMVLGWRAVQEDGTAWHWLGVGLAMGLAFLSKYTALYQILCFGLFFVLWPTARVHLRRRGPWLALAVVGLCMVPVLVWNAQHKWVTLSHVSENASLHEHWKPTLRHLLEFTGAELGLLNPVFFVAALWAMLGFWKLKPAAAGRQPARPAALIRGTLMLYLFCMGAPVFLGHWLYTLHSQVQPNWIAPALVPMFCLMALYWEQRWREGVRGVVGWLRGGVVFGCAVVLLVHVPELVDKAVGKPLPPDKDPLRRVRAWQASGEVVSTARARLMAEGKPVFIIVHHYGITGELSFYLPEARPAPGREPLVYSVLGPAPENQFYFWPEYRYRNLRKGQNAIFVIEPDVPSYSMKAWFRSLFTGELGPLPEKCKPETFLWPVPYEFESVKDLGVIPVFYRGQVYRWLQLVECRNLR